MMTFASCSTFYLFYVQKCNDDFAVNFFNFLLFIFCVYTQAFFSHMYNLLSWNLKTIYGGQEPNRYRVIVLANQAT